MKNFFSNSLEANKYFKILTKYKKKFSKEFLLKNYGLFIGDKAFYKMLKCFEIIKETSNVKGDIIEFGVWNGNNLIMIKKILDYFNLKKKVIGYDNFKGMPKPDKKNYFIGDKKLVYYICKFFNLKNIKIIEDDIMSLKNHVKKMPKLSIIYIDCDLYNTTKKILKLLSSKLNKGGLIVFDEANFDRAGEGKAAEEFYKKNRKNFKKILLKKYYQPDYVLKKIK